MTDMFRKAPKWFFGVLCCLAGVVVLICFLTNSKEEEDVSQNVQGTQTEVPDAKEEISSFSATGYYIVNGGIYKYCLELSGVLPNLEIPLSFTVYTNKEEVTFQEVAEYYFGISEDESMDMYVFCPQFVAVEQEEDVLVEEEVLIPKEKIFYFVIVDEDTGEAQEISAFDFSKIFDTLNLLYADLKFEAAAQPQQQEDSAYSLHLYDVEGALLQTVTPYISGVDMDGVYYDCGLNQTGKKLFTYLDLLFARKAEEAGEPVITEITKESGNHQGTGLIIGERFEGDIDKVEGVELTISELGKRIGLHVSNETGKEVRFGSQYSIQILVNDEWYYLEPMNGSAFFTSEAYSAPMTVYEDYSGIYGILPPTTFRVVKSISVYDDNTKYTDYRIATEELHVTNYMADE